MADKLTTFYVLHGDESIAMDKALAKIRAGMGSGPNADLNTSEFEGETASAAEVLNAASSFPFLSDKRLIIVYNMISHITRRGAGETGKKQLEELLERLPTLPEYARFVMVERGTLPENNKIVQLAASHPNGYMKCFEAPKDMTTWIIKRAKSEYQVDIEHRAADALASVIRDDIRRADNELLKLACYRDDGGMITVHDVERLTPYVAEANVFNMVDAIVAGKADIALELMHRALNDEPRDPGFGMFMLIVNHFRRLLLTREHLTNGGSSNSSDIAKAIGIRSSWQADKLSKQSRAFTVDQLDHIYRTLQNYDFRMKTGQIPVKLALDLIVAGLARSE